MDQQAGHPRQFRMIDLFALTTLVALVVAMLAPVVRAMKREDVVELIVVLSLQLVAAGGVAVYAMYRRAQLLERSGRRIGIGYCGSMGWRHWPVTKSVIIMLGIVLGQLSVAMMIADGFRGVGNNPFALLYQFQLAMFSGSWFARYLWRVYPNSMEFFEHGVSLGGATFLPWQQVELRPSRYFADRLVLVLRPAADSVTAQTRLAQVPDALRVDILSRGRSGVGGGSRSASPGLAEGPVHSDASARRDGQKPTLNARNPRP